MEIIYLRKVQAHFHMKYDIFVDDAVFQGPVKVIICVKEY